MELESCVLTQHKCISERHRIRRYVCEDSGAVRVALHLIIRIRLAEYNLKGVSAGDGLIPGALNGSCNRGDSRVELERPVNISDQRKGYQRQEQCYDECDDELNQRKA